MGKEKYQFKSKYTKLEKEEIKKQIFDKLTYITKQQADELIKRNTSLQKSLKFSIIASLVLGISTLIIFLPLMGGQAMSLKFLFLTCSALFAIYPSLIMIEGPRKSYEKQRELMTKAISGEFCTHLDKHKCTCKDEFAEYMLKYEKINLMF